ncbi:MAG: ABC transporter substrate binding protein [Pseudomonadota bacterium]
MAFHAGWKFFLLLILIMIMGGGAPALAKDKYRIGYLQGGDYPTYNQLFKALMKEFKNIGWEDKLEFPPDACLDAKWNKDDCERLARELAARKDLDMIWAMGTWAGLAMIKTDNHTTPICVLSVSNAVESGIIPGYNDSGRDNLTTRIDPTKYERQLRLFHTLFQFKKLGVVYADTPTGRTYADLPTLVKLSRELGFELVTYNKVPENKNEAPAAILEGIKEIAPKIDAYYMTICIGFELDHVPGVMEILNQYKIPTMAMYGSDYVRAGALMTIADSLYIQRAVNKVEKMVKIFQGTKPRDLPVIFEPGPRLAINLAEAKIISWDPPVDILSISDEVYQKIWTLEEIIEQQKIDWADQPSIEEKCGQGKASH